MTGREHEVFRLAAKGLSNSEIADELFISVVTVKGHLNSIFKKLGLRSRHQLIAHKIDLEEEAS